MSDDIIPDEDVIELLRSLPAEQALHAGDCSVTGGDYYFFVDEDGTVWYRKSEWPLAHPTLAEIAQDHISDMEWGERVPRTEAMKAPDMDTEPTITTALREHDEYEEITYSEFPDANLGGKFPLYEVGRALCDEHYQDDARIHRGPDQTFGCWVSLSDMPPLLYRPRRVFTCSRNGASNTMSQSHPIR